MMNQQTADTDRSTNEHLAELLDSAPTIKINSREEDFVSQNNSSPHPTSPQRASSWSQYETVFEHSQEFFDSLPSFDYVERRYDEIIAKAKEENRLAKVLADMGISDRYFLLTRILRRKDARREMVYKLCRMVELEPDGYLDIWAREHYKTSIITFAGTIQEVIKNPEITICIFSFTKPIAKSFLKQIMREMEQNELLKLSYPGVFWQDPRKESKKRGFSWSADSGITVIRKGNQKEATVEAWGLTDGQPTSKHFDLRIYNDIVTRDTVRTKTSISNTNDGWELSLNLGSAVNESREWYEGTIYHNRDTYSLIRDRGAAIPRIVPITYNRRDDGEPVMYDKKYVKEKRRTSGLYNFSCQCLLLPQRAGAMSFHADWIKKWSPDKDKYKNMTLYLIVDPASSKKEEADFTVMIVYGLAFDRNMYVIDMIRDRLSLRERTKTLFELHKKYRPDFVGYEKYGKDSDIEHIEWVMEEEAYRFHIQEVGGKMNKPDRIMRLQPDFENGRIILPYNLRKVNKKGDMYDAVEDFIIREYQEWPYPTHDDMLDCLSRKYDLEEVYPDKEYSTLSYQEDGEVERWNAFDYKGGWGLVR